MMYIINLVGESRKKGIENSVLFFVSAHFLLKIDLIPQKLQSANLAKPCSSIQLIFPCKNYKLNKHLRIGNAKDLAQIAFAAVLSYNIFE
jgi:hypothetical protein